MLIGPSPHGKTKYFIVYDSLFPIILLVNYIGFGNNKSEKKIWKFVTREEGNCIFLKFKESNQPTKKWKFYVWLRCGYMCKLALLHGPFHIFDFPNQSKT